jgi:hypothetical protein
MPATRFILTLSALYISFGVDAQACVKSVVMTTTGDDGRTIELVIDSTAVQQTPEWSPGRGDPPLSVARASEIAQDWADQKYARFDSVEIREITLGAPGCVSNNKHWFYIFDFMPVMQGQRMYSGGNWAAVLMNGTVIGAEQRGSQPTE